MTAGGSAPSHPTTGARVGSGGARMVRRFAAPEPQLAFWVAGWTALAAAVLGVLVPLLTRGPAVTFVEVTVVFRIVGGSFAACGLVAWRRRPDNHSGRLMTATGFAFLAAPLLAQLDTPLARTAGLLLRNVWLLLLVAILLTFLSGGRLRTRTDRVIVGAVAASLLVISPLWLVFLDVPGNVLFLWPDARTAATVDAVQQWLYLPIALAVTAVVGARWWRASRPGRRALLPSVAGSVYLLFFTVVLTTGLVGLPVPYAVFWVLAFSVAMVPVAFLTGLLRSRLARGALVELFRGMRAMHPTDLRAALARALGDPALVIAYPVAGQRAFVDADDRPVTLPAEGDLRSAAMVERDGEVVAALVYDRSLDDDPELVEAVGGRPPSRWRTSSCTSRRRTGSPSCGRPGNGSSPRGTPNGAGSSATCTTAPSSASSPSRCSSRSSGARSATIPPTPSSW